ncbi:MAG: 50S ribosomal protein L35 [Phycisphaerae bacterium]
MAKHKTHKGMMKRVKITATGKIKFHKHNKGHLQSSKSGNRRRRLRGTTSLTGPFAAKIITLLGPSAR